MSDPAEASPLRSRSARLRPVRGTDMDWLYELLVLDHGSRWRYRGRTPSPQDFAVDLWRGVITQFVVDDAAGAPCGLVGGYNANLQASHCHVFAVGATDRSAAVTEGAGLMIGWLFDRFDFAKIWIETPGFNLAQYASINDVARVEGRLSNFDYWGGRFWDQYILSISRQRWDETLAPLVASRSRVLPRRSDRSALAGSLDDLEQVLVDLVPLDSLGAVELLAYLEDAVDQPLDVSVIDGLESMDVDAAAVLLRSRLSALTAAQQSGLGRGRGTCGGNGQEPSSVEWTYTSSSPIAST